MRAPTLGSDVLILDKPKGSPVDGVLWTVWAQSPTGWHLFRRDEQGGGPPSNGATSPHGSSKPARKGMTD